MTSSSSTFPSSSTSSTHRQRRQQQHLNGSNSLDAEMMHITTITTTNPPTNSPSQSASPSNDDPEESAHQMKSHHRDTTTILHESSSSSPFLSSSNRPPEPPVPSCQMLKNPIFIFAALYVTALFIYCTYESITTSQDLHNRYNTAHIKRGWLFGRYFDDKDAQWGEFRRMLPLLCIAGFFFLGISNLLRRLGTRPNNPLRISWYLVTSVIIIYWAHGYRSIWVLVAAFVNYAIAMAFEGTKLNPIFTWIWNLSVLFLANYYDGLPFYKVLGPEWGFLDRNRGILSWETYFKLTMCRLVSFNMDYYWAVRSKNGEQQDSSAQSKTKKFWSEYTTKQETSRPLGEYNFVDYFIYAFYIPFYIAGPLVSFNAFAAQLREPQSTMKPRGLLWLAIRVVSYVLLVELMLHFIYYHNFNLQNYWLRKNLPFSGVFYCSWWTLQFMFLKYLIIWRFFRLWGLIDGFDSPENMLRCVDNNNTFTGFWRSWHGSLNKWIIRYLYKPLGGARTQLWNIWLIFSFVGLWHDLWWRWLAWAWINCLFFSLEIAVMVAVRRIPSVNRLRFRWWWRYLVAFALAFNIINLMVANLAVIYGFDGSFLYIKTLFWRDHFLPLFAFGIFTFFCGNLLIQEIRNHEKRKAIAMGRDPTTII